MADNKLPKKLLNTMYQVLWDAVGGGAEHTVYLGFNLSHAQQVIEQLYAEGKTNTRLVKHESSFSVVDY